MKKIRRFSFALGLGLAAACGGESDGGDADGGGAGTGGPPLDTGLPGETPLAELTPAQYAGACEELRNDVSNRLGREEAVRGACEVLQAGFTETPAACSSEADVCVRQTEDGTNPFFSADDLDFTTFECGDVDELEGCDVSIAEFEACLNDRVALLERLLADNSCANAASVEFTDAVAAADLGNVDAPPSCARVDAECPTAGPFAAPE